MIYNVELTQENLMKQVNYNPELGEFRRITKTSTTDIKYIIPRKSKDEYTYFRVMCPSSKKVSAQHLAWLYVYGVWSTKFIFHLNGDKSDNRISNLVEFSRHEYSELNNTKGRVKKFNPNPTNKILNKIHYNLTQSMLLDRFRYEDGNLIRLSDNKIAGTISKTDGYVYIRVHGVVNRFVAHRLIWLYHHGEWPKEFIDHIDRNPSNNRIENLRECTQQENMQNTPMKCNNYSKLKGVHYIKKTNKYYSKISVNGKRISLGYYFTAEEASKVYNDAAKFYFGDFYNKDFI